jgi:uncharacterized protein YidB (DUF937 family)
MGLFDDAVPGGGIAKPLMVALGTLLIGRMVAGGMMHGSDGTQPAGGAAGGPASGSATPNSGAAGGGAAGGLGGALGNLLPGGLAGGLGGLLDQLKSAGHSEVTNSWVGDGSNKSIEPQQLGTAIGQTTLSDLARHSGLTEEELLNQLSRTLPGVVDKLTPGGRVPSQNEIATLLSNDLKS